MREVEGPYSGSICHAAPLSLQSAQWRGRWTPDPQAEGRNQQGSCSPSRYLSALLATPTFLEPQIPPRGLAPRHLPWVCAENIGPTVGRESQEGPQSWV